MGLPSVHSRRRLYKSCIVETGILRHGLGALARPDYYRSSIQNEPLERHDETAADPGKVSLRGVVCRGVSSDLRSWCILISNLGIGLGYIFKMALRVCRDRVQPRP